MRFRILASILLMIGFYVLALVVGIGLLVAAYESVDRGQISSILWICGASGGAILWSLIPRRDKFIAPGPRLMPDAQPELFALVRGVADAVGEAMPEEVYLVPNVNAFVAHRGGAMGFGSRRVMGIGLPLLQALTASQLRAVLAHEFGHYAAGDLKLGGWIYKTRATMARTITNLGKVRSLVYRPFLAYGNLFMRVTQAVARAQEIAADRMAVRIAGARSQAAALRACHGAMVAFGTYWTSEVVPVLSEGYQPPIGAGFARFIRAEGMAKAIDVSVARELQNGTSDPYDSHPPLAERLAAIEREEGDRQECLSSTDDPPASSLIRDLPRLEREILVAVSSDPKAVETLKAIEWHETAMTVFLPAWRDRSEKLADLVANATMADIPSLARSRELAVALGITKWKPEDRDREMRAAAAAIVATKLVDDGWTCTTAPGEDVVFTKEERQFVPFLEAQRDAEAWTAAVRSAGIEELPLTAGSPVEPCDGE